MTGATVTVALRGEADVTSAGLLSAWLDRIRDSGPRRLVFDVTLVSYMDCASARLLAGTGQWLPPGTRPVIRGPSELVRRVLAVSRIGLLCELEPGEPGAGRRAPGLPPI